MIPDTSALTTIFFDEPEAARFAQLIDFGRLAGQRDELGGAEIHTDGGGRRPGALHQSSGRRKRLPHMAMQPSW